MAGAAPGTPRRVQARKAPFPVSGSWPFAVELLSENRDRDSIPQCTLQCFDQTELSESRILSISCTGLSQWALPPSGLCFSRPMSPDACFVVRHNTTFGQPRCDSSGRRGAWGSPLPLISPPTEPGDAGNSTATGPPPRPRQGRVCVFTCRGLPWISAAFSRFPVCAEGATWTTQSARFRHIST